MQEKAVFFSETETSAQRPNPSNGGRPQFLKSRDKSEKVDEQKKSFATKKILIDFDFSRNPDVSETRSNLCGIKIQVLSLTHKKATSRCPSNVQLDS